ncbi:MAG: radical SAM family heme chaperone HemW [Clostridia bacterium]
MRKPLSLYIHIPFCNSKCIYCSFVSCVAGNNQKQLYTDALINEIKIRGREYNPTHEIKTIYVGGGTPSCLENGEIRRIMSAVYQNFTVVNGAEITIEINPNTLTDEKIREYQMSGFNRFSLGLQCAQAPLLKLMGRTHTWNDYEKAIKMLKTSGFDNISTDIMLGLPTQTKNDVKETLNKVISLGVTHISAYMLSVEDETPLKRMVDSSQLLLPTEKETLLMYKTTAETLKANGYDRYEVSNWSKPGFQSAHNKVYWSRGDYLGLGVSSHSFINPVRLANTENILEYVNNITKGKVPVVEADKISVDEAKEEFVMLSLRLETGLDTNEYERQFKENFLAKHKEKISELFKLKLLTLNAEGFLKPTETGYMLLNKIILELV